MKKVFVLFLIVSGMNAFGQKAVPEGAINGLFSIANGRQVYFSKGNLQYQASTNTWRFAENQWDYVGGKLGGVTHYGNVDGSSNNNISESYSGWIDLFGWGTSGYAHGAVCYQPWSTSGNENDYMAFGNITNDLGGQADWGYNRIVNGGNEENQWMTLAHVSWEYLLIRRPTPSGMRYVNALVNDVLGIAILPDDWDVSYCELIPSGNGVNVFSAEQWKNQMESHGAVFLPEAGYRQGATVNSAGNSGNYAASSINRKGGGYSKPNKVYSLSFNGKGLISVTTFGSSRADGYSVRLVRVAN